jgi:fibronectin-binding autotransporter adhesin
VGVAQIYRANTFSGGVNIFEGTIEAYNNGSALGTGPVALGGTGSSTNATLRVGNGITITNAMTVNSGSGARTIANDSARAGNATLSGGLTLNTNATFAITSVTGGSHDRMTLSGAVGGAGGLVKTDTGILILSSSGNSYSGATDIRGGKLYLGTSGRLGSGAVTISNGANLDFGTGQTSIVANSISGEGEIFQNVAGTDTRLTGNVTSTGGLTINAGTLRIGNGGTTGSYSGSATVASGAVLAFARENAYTHGGTISGAGGVTKVNAGDVTLTASNSYSGVTTLFAGALVAGDANALGTGDITFNPGGGNSGAIRYTAASAGTDWASRIVNSTGTIRLDTDGNNVNLAGAVASNNTGGLVKSGTGTLTLGGNNAYGGATEVQGGSLIINGDQSAATGVLTVATNATLGGSGIIGGATTISGIHSPGNSPGIQTFSSDLTYAGTPTVEWELTGNTTTQGSPTPVFDQIIVGGNLDFSVPTTLTLNFALPASTVDWNNSLWASDITGTAGWLLYDVTGTLSNVDNLSISAANWADGQGALFDTVRAGSSFSLYKDGNDIYLNYAVPEPSTYALLALAAVGLGAHVVRRRRNNR